MSNKINFRQILIEALKQSEMTQAELAIKSNITEASISRYVNGQRVPTFEKALRIINALGKEVIIK